MSSHRVTIPPTRPLHLSDSTLAYRTWGEPSGKPLIFWHALGTSPSGAYLAEVAPILTAAHDLWIVALDAPGFGASPALGPAEYENDRMVNRFGEVVRALQLHQPILMGHSWGGVLASFLAAQLGQEAGGLVLLDSGHIDYRDAPGFRAVSDFEELLEDARRPERVFAPQPWEQFEEELRGEVRRWAPAIPAIIRAGVRMENGLATQIPTPEVGAAARYGLGQRRVSESWPAIKGAGIPVLLVTASEPPEARAANRIAARRFQTAIPEATVLEMPNAGHDLLLDAGPALAEAISEWLTATS